MKQPAKILVALLSPVLPATAFAADTVGLLLNRSGADSGYTLERRAARDAGGE